MATEPTFNALELAHDAAVLGDPPPASSWTPTDLNDLPDKPPVEPTLGATGLVYPGKRHVFSGPPESAKTLAAYCVMIQTVRTGDPVVLIDFEMGGYDARQRLRELGATRDEISRIHYLEPDEQATVQKIVELVALKPALVVIDAAAGAYALEGLDDNKRGDVERMAKLYIAIFWRNGIATILIDHVVKDAEMRGRFQIGSERKLGSSDVHLGFTVDVPISRGRKGLYSVTTHKDRGGYLKRGHLVDLSLDSDPKTNAITWSFTEPKSDMAEAGYYRPTGLMERVSIDLELRHEPVSRNTVCESVTGTKRYILKALDALVREGFVTEQDGPNRSRELTSARRYRQDDAACNPAEQHDTHVVREWFGSGSGTTDESGGSVVRPPYGDDTTRATLSQTAEPHGWFAENGELADADAAWLASIDPGGDVDFNGGGAA